MNVPNSAMRPWPEVRSFALAGATEKTILMPAAWACGSHDAMSASPGIVVGFDASQLIETRFTFSPMSFSVAKNDAPASPVDLPASSVFARLSQGSHVSSAREKKLLSRRGSHPATALHRT